MATQPSDEAQDERDERDERAEQAERASKRPARTLPRRLAPLVIVAGALASSAIFIPSVPRERRVELRLDSPATVLGLSVEWVPSARSPSSLRARDDEPVHGAAWHFLAGTAPPSVVTTVHLPDGPYELHLFVERPERTDEVRRSLTLGDAEQIAVPVR